LDWAAGWARNIGRGRGGQSLFVIGLGDAQVGTVGGASCSSAVTPDDTSASFYTADDMLFVGAVDGECARRHEPVGSKWNPLS
jgi:hypothetical protein